MKIWHLAVCGFEAMGAEMVRNKAIQVIGEMEEFATFSVAEQRYICRSLDVAAQGAGAISRWSRSEADTANIKAQDKLYRTLLQLIRNTVPDDIDMYAMGEVTGQLIIMSAFDLSGGNITRFSAYRFLYERLLGPSVRPWLASAFVGASALPYLHPDLRKALLASITADEAASAGWSNCSPVFVPQWVEEPEITVSRS